MFWATFKDWKAIGWNTLHCSGWMVKREKALVNPFTDLGSVPSIRASGMAVPFFNTKSNTFVPLSIPVNDIFWIYFPELNMKHMSYLLDKVFLIFPNYCLGMSFSQFYQNYEFITFCNSSPPFSRIACEIMSKYYLTAASESRCLPLVKRMLLGKTMQSTITNIYGDNGGGSSLLWQ